MRSPLQALSLILLTSAATTAVVLPIATAQSPQDPVAVAPAVQPAQSPAPQLVTGLPDFTGLVDRVGPAVVNIESIVGGRASARSQAQSPDGQFPGEDQMPEFFRRFFGPGFQMPGPDQQPNAPRGRSMGTGFIISADGYVLTNHHVIAGADEVKVTLSDRREFTAKIVGSDERSDVALLKIDGKNLPLLRTGDAASVKPGQWAVAIGSPFGLDQSVTAGIVSAVGRSNPYANQQYVPFIQTDVAINRGNSGGPLLNTRGEVVGINSQIFSNSGGYMGVSFAIPMDVAMNVAQQIKTTGKVSRGQIGVSVGAVSSDMVKGFGLPDTRGALVNDVLTGSPAEKAGLEPGDVIRSVDGIAIDDSSDLPPVIGAMAPGATAKLDILRNGKPIQRNVTLTRLDETDVAGNPRRVAPREPAAAKAENRLGLVGEDLDADQRRELGLKAGEGVALARIEGKAGRKAGLRPGDIVLRVGTTPVGSVSALERELGKVREDQTAMLLVRRGAATQFLAVTPDES